MDDDAFNAWMFVAVMVSISALAYAAQLVPQFSLAIAVGAAIGVIGLWDRCRREHKLMEGTEMMQRVCDGCKKVIGFGNFIHMEWDGNPAVQRSMDSDVKERDFHDWDCVEDFLKESGKADYVRAIKNGGDGK